MKNLILSITRTSIPYVKELKRLQCSSPLSVTACILMQQLDYWFAKKPEGYYKFLEPCEHPDYRHGDSWTEELGFSAEEFETAFKKIGVKYKSKTEFSNAADKFQNKFYACYYDRTLRRLVFLRNHRLLDSALDNLIANISQSSDKGGGGSSRNRHTRFPRNHENQFVGNHDLRPLDSEISGLGKPITMGSLYIDTNTTTENITDNSLLSLNKTMTEINAEREMINIWNKIVEEGANPINLTPARKRQLDKALVEHFNSNVSEWEAFCHLISASKWLMGESGKSTWKASIDWALLPENIVKIKEKSYGIGDRKKFEKEHDTRAAEEEKLKSQIISRRFDEVIQKARGLRKEELLSIEVSLDQQALEALKEEFQESIRNGSKGEGAKDSFNELGWNMPFIDTIYQGFKEERLLASQEVYLQNAAEELGYDLNQMQHLIEKQFSKSIDQG